MKSKPRYFIFGEEDIIWRRKSYKDWTYCSLFDNSVEWCGAAGYGGPWDLKYLPAIRKEAEECGVEMKELTEEDVFAELL